MTAAPPAAGAALELILRATVLIGAAWAVAALFRKAGASAATRHLVWQLGIFALLALPLVWWVAPPLHLPILGAEAVHAAVETGPFEPAAPAMPESTPIWGPLLAYLVGAAAVLLRLALSRYLVSRLWPQAEPARDPGAGGAVTSAHFDMDGLRVGAGAEFTVSRRAFIRAEARYTDYHDGGNRGALLGAFGFRF